MSKTEKLPNGWLQSTLGDVFTWSSGGTPRSGNAGYYGGDIPWVIIGDLDDGTVIETQRYITEDGLKNSSAKWVEEGSILLAMYGSIGKLGIAGRRLTTNQAIAFTKTDPIDSKYLFYYLYYERGHLNRLGTGATQLNISQTLIKSYPFTLAPLAEQHRIVEKIEELLSEVEASIKELESAQKKLKLYRASVLNAACSGKLVPTEAELAKKEKRSYETGAELLARILKERREKWNGRGKYVEPTEPDTTNLPTLPEGWMWASLDQLLSSMRNGISAKPDATSGLPILRISAVRPLSVDLAEVRFLNASEADYSDYLLSEGDILFTRYNGNPLFVGVCGVVPHQVSPLVYPDKLIRCRLASDLALPDFVATMANVGSSRSYLSKRVRTTAGQSGISGGDLKGLPIPLAPSSEQGRIIAETERRLSVVDETEGVLSLNLMRATRLRQSILEQAFSGKLVPQDPSDEPASVLLEKIKAEREKAASTKKAPRGRKSVKKA